MKMPWGKHAGTEISEVPESYLRWVLEKCDNVSPVLREAIRLQLGLPSESTTAGQVVALVFDLVKGVYREMSIRFHPDRGGSTEQMIAINNFRDRLQETLSDKLPKAPTNKD